MIFQFFTSRENVFKSYNDTKQVEQFDDPARTQKNYRQTNFNRNRQ